MTDQIQGRAPRHAGHTREMPLVGYTPQHQAPEKPEAVNPHLEADGSKAQYWPLSTPAVDPIPTGRFTVPAPRPHIPHPNVVVDPAPRRLSWPKALLLAAGLIVPLVAAVVLVATS